MEGIPKKGRSLVAICKSVIFLISICISNFAICQDNTPDTKTFIPDTTIDAVLKLLNPRSIRKAIGDQRARMIDDDKGTHVQLVSAAGPSI
jgi:hypothetical protein